jgi:hypothetical protein
MIKIKIHSNDQNQRLCAENKKAMEDMNERMLLRSQCDNEYANEPRQAETQV